MCKCKSKIRGMARRKIKVGSFQPAAEVFVGLLAAKTFGDQALSRVQFVQQNPTLGTVIKAGLGVFLTTQRSSTMKNIGSGMIVNGLSDVYDQYLKPSSVAGRLPSVRGASTNFPQERFETHRVASMRGASLVD